MVAEAWAGRLGGGVAGGRRQGLNDMDSWWRRGGMPSPVLLSLCTVILEGVLWRRRPITFTGRKEHFDGGRRPSQEKTLSVEYSVNLSFCLHLRPE